MSPNPLFRPTTSLPTRVTLALRMTEENIPALFEGRAEVVNRRFELLARENDARNHNMLTAIARTKARP